MNLTCINTAKPRVGFRLIPIAFFLLFFSFIFSFSFSLDAKTTTSTGDGNWNVAGTWNNGIPVAGDTVIIGSRDNVTVPNGYTARCAIITFDDNKNSSIVLSTATSSLIATGTVTIRNPGNRNTIEINVGAGTFSAGALTLQGATANRLTLLNISTGSATIGGNITTSGIGSRILFSGAGTLRVGGNFMTGTVGQFTASTSTVIFNGAGASTIFGSHTFNNLSCSTASKSIQITAGTTQTVGGVFTINGGAVGTRVTLASTGGAGTTWNLVLNGSYSVNFVAVQGSNASGTVLFPINPSNSINNGNNTNWFPPQAVTYNGNGNTGGTAPVDTSSPYDEGATVTVLNKGTLVKTGSLFSNWNTAADGSGTSYNPGNTFSMPVSPVTLHAQWAKILTISGTVYTDEAKTTPIAAGKNVSISVNGAAVQLTTTGAGGTFTFTPTVNPNDVLLVFVDGETEKASLVTKSDGATDLNGGNALELVQGKIILEHQTGSEITNTQLDVIDGVDAGDDDGISILTGNATFASGREVWISSGKTYNPGGNVILNDLELFGSFTGGANTITVNGSWDNNGGNFSGDTSTVFFATSADANISGSTTFNNFRCVVPGKKLIFEEGSTTTVSGMLHLQGERATNTRIFLASSGGDGTISNLVLNGNHDCNYVDVQGSNVSGTVYLPINPAGYFNNGDNTNWYASTLPDDVVFYDNFENSTLGSADPDRESSYWATPTWSNTPAETVNTYNHTAGGNQSMYAGSTTAGNGEASWNNPEWGPVDNGVAECWFYDDMTDGLGKRIWASVESSDGQEWAAIGISTANSATKYTYHQGSGGAPQPTQTTFIDRSLGWHKATWIRDINFITLYLDDVQIYQGANSQLDNFADFDLGSWGYDNPNGSTGMWFDDCVVYRSQHQSAYRWYENDNDQNPTPIAAEDTAITREINTPTRVRIQLQNDMAMDWGVNPTYVGLQYRQGTTGSWVDLGPSSHWEYIADLAIDGNQVDSALLTNTNIRQHFVRSQPSAQILSSSPTEYPEWDFLIQANGNASIGSDYFFRMVVVTSPSGAYLKPFAAYPFLAECQITSLTMWIWTGAVSNDWNDPANWNQATIPDATSDVIIQTGVARDPRINISGAVCKSLVIQAGMTLLLDTAGTDLTVSNNMTVNGTVTHSSGTATLNINAGELRIDGGTYDHTGNGVLNAPNADLRILNLGVYNFSSQATMNLKDFYVDNFGAFNDGTAAGTLNVLNFNLLANGQFSSNQTGSIYNVSGNFANDGSMLGSTGGVFNFNGTGKTYSGTAPNHVFYQANFNGTYTFVSTADITYLDDVTIGATGSLTAGTGTMNVGGDWINNNTFVNGSGSVNFNGTALQQITSNGSDWFNLTVSNGSGAGISFLDGFTTTTLTNTTANSTMTFNTGSTYNITGASGLTLSGTAGNEITLASSTPGTPWLINPSGGGWNVDYVNVTDSVNIYGDAILPTNSTDGGNNIGWFALDLDNDEIPDFFEFIHYGTLTNGPLSDTDGDGLNLLEEFVLDSDPNVDGTPVLFVDDNAGYIGNGSAGTPFKYIKEALDAAGTDGTLISLEEGTYELDDYLLTKKVIIRGSKGAVKTIIHGGTPDGGTSDSGSFLQVASKDFGLAHVTLRMFRDDKPIITYTGASDVKTFLLNGVVFRDNNTQTKAMIAPSATGKHKYVYMYNCLFYNNTGLTAAKMNATKDVQAYNNTIVNNTFTSALFFEGSAKRYTLYNNILRNSSTEITDNTSSGTVLISNCNIEGGYAGAIASYDTAETFADAANGYYRLLSGSNGENVGITTAVVWDMDHVSRPQGAEFDVGCYETDPNDQDGDGLTTAQETAAGTNATNPDTDGDGIIDGEEINTWGTNPLSSNSDGDFIDDGDEILMGMDPAVDDGDGDIQGTYYTSFESDLDFPVGPLSDTIWGPNGNINSTLVIKGNVTIENVGAGAAYDGAKVGKIEGSPGGGLVESSFVGWVDRNSLDNYWMSISYKSPRAKLPTDINEAFNLAGSFFAIDENGYLNIWDPSNEEWLKDTQVIPDDWTRITVHRDHPGKTINMWVETRQAFAGVPISSPDPTAGTGKFRISFSSVGEQDAFFDLFSALPFAPF